MTERSRAGRVMFILVFARLLLLTLLTLLTRFALVMLFAFFTSFGWARYPPEPSGSQTANTLVFGLEVAKQVVDSVTLDPPSTAIEAETVNW